MTGLVRNYQLKSESWLFEDNRVKVICEHRKEISYEELQFYRRGYGIPRLARMTVTSVNIRYSICLKISQDSYYLQIF